ncbi:TonB system transport protein ExbD [Cypionkella aquatica]|uniref:Biopolymer transport protein ExbD n=1 Tax=Cypionkella aquatica TaxID=1756042 RepID=A0AA37TQB3_9RHOB|nr:TonB system transport protein ExbD [Cypionkella aquatica]
MGMTSRGTGDDLEENHEINVTPFIDVMLVLLIIFMVAAPLSTVDVPVDLPGSNAAPADRAPEPVYITVQKDLTLSLASETIDRAALGARLDVLTNGDRSQRIYLRADETVAYGKLMAVMNLLRASGYLKVALVGIEGAAVQP